MVASFPALADEPQHDDFIVLHGVTWVDYQRLLELRGDHSAPRFTYIEGVLEITNPSRSHESIKSMIGRLVEAYCLESGIEFSTYGSWTIEDKEADRGAEPDECYVFSDVADPKRPDLAIEVEWSRARVDKLNVYRKLGVREVWIYRAHPSGHEGPPELRPYVLRGETYRPVDKSRALPGLDLAELARLAGSTIPTSRVIREYRALLAARAPSAKTARKSPKR